MRRAAGQRPGLQVTRRQCIRKFQPRSSRSREERTASGTVFPLWISVVGTCVRNVVCDATRHKSRGPCAVPAITGPGSLSRRMPAPLREEIGSTAPRQTAALFNEFRDEQGRTVSLGQYFASAGRARVRVYECTCSEPGANRSPARLGDEPRIGQDTTWCGQFRTREPRRSVRQEGAVSRTLKKLVQSGWHFLPVIRHRARGDQGGRIT